MTGRKVEFLDNYWVRLPEKFPRIIAVRRLKSLAKAAPGDRLVAALLRGDRAGALQVLGAPGSAVFLERLISGGTTERLSALLYERLCQLELAEAATGQVLSTGASLLDTLRALATRTYTLFATYDELFVKLYDELGEFQKQILWIKGPVLGRTLYAKPHFRFSVDFDLLVEPGAIDRVAERLQSGGFAIDWSDPGECHQLGTGPVGSLADLRISPSAEFEPINNISLQMSGWPHVELKCDPWNRGLKAATTERIFAGAEELVWRGRRFLYPSTVDHLLIELVHFHKHGFDGWHWLYDIHLLASKLTETPGRWQQLVERCRLEDELAASAWAGLELARETLGSPVPPEVTSALAPADAGLWGKVFTYTVSTDFLWNRTSLPMLLLNAAFLGDRARKTKVLRQCLCPSREFLSRYYGGGKQVGFWTQRLYLLAHWVVLLLPGGLARRTLGRLIWRTPS